MTTSTTSFLSVRKSGDRIYVCHPETPGQWQPLYRGQHFMVWLSVMGAWYLYFDKKRKGCPPRLLVYRETRRRNGRKMFERHWSLCFSLVIRADEEYSIGPRQDPRRDREKRKLFRRKPQFRRAAYLGDVDLMAA